MTPHQLPPGSKDFTGRTDLLARLDGALLPSGTATVTGMAGVGKTALVVRWAQTAAGAFPDGELYVDLCGFGPEEPLRPMEALAAMLRALGHLRPETLTTVEERAAHFRTLMSGRRALVVIDNALSVDHVRPLLPGTESCAVIVISRHSMSGMVVHHASAVVPVEPLPEVDGLALLRHAVGERVAEPDAVRLVRLCAGLPLALRIASERVARTSWSLAELPAGLDGDGRLDFLDSGDDARSAVRTVFSWSYRGLTEDQAQAFRLLGLHPGGPFGARASAALLGIDHGKARALLRSLARKHLVINVGHDRFQMHDLVREYAQEVCGSIEPVEARTRALTGLYDHYLHTADRAGRLIMPHRLRVPLDGIPQAVPDLSTRQDALSWFTEERRNMEAMFAFDDPAFDGRRWQLAYTLRDYYFLDKLLDGWRQTHLLALDGCLRSEDRLAEARTRNNLGMVLVETGELDEAMRQYVQAERLFEEARDPHGISNALANQGAVLRRLGALDEALRNQERALTWYVRSGAQRNVGITLRGMALVAVELGRSEEAVGYAEKAVDIALGLGLDLDAAEAFGRLGRVHRHTGNDALAEIALQRAVEHSKRCGSRYEEARALHDLGGLAASAGRTDDALQLLSESLDLYRRLGSGTADSVEAELRALTEQR